MEILDFMQKIISLDPIEVFEKLKKREGYSDYTKSEAPFGMQPEGKIYTVYMHDFYYKNGDCVAYKVKEFKSNSNLRADGQWECYSAADDVWYSYEDGEFVQIGRAHV